MKILLLSPYEDPAIHVAFKDDEWTRISAPIETIAGFDIAVSYGYKHIIQHPPPNRIVNLHISYLPWNRGMHPNVWSWIDKTPKGVSIHYIDDGIDTGPIILQREVTLDDARGTLESTYRELRTAIERLFIDNWDYIKTLPTGTPQPNGGSFHLAKDLPILPDGYNTRVRHL